VTIVTNSDKMQKSPEPNRLGKRHDPPLYAASMSVCGKSSPTKSSGWAATQAVA